MGIFAGEAVRGDVLGRLGSVRVCKLQPSLEGSGFYPTRRTELDPVGLLVAVACVCVIDGVDMCWARILSFVGWCSS